MDPNRGTSQDSRGPNRGRGPGFGRGGQQPHRGGSRGRRGGQGNDQQQHENEQRRGSSASFNDRQGNHFHQHYNTQHRDSHTNYNGRQDSFPYQTNNPPYGGGSSGFAQGPGNFRNQGYHNSRRGSDLPFTHGHGNSQNQAYNNSARGRSADSSHGHGGYPSQGYPNGHRPSGSGYGQGGYQNQDCHSFNRGGSPGFRGNRSASRQRGGQDRRGSSNAQASSSHHQAPHSQQNLVEGPVTHFLANYYQITVGGVKMLYHYDISIKKVTRHGEPVKEDEDTKKGEGGSMQLTGSKKKQKKKKNADIPALKKRRLIQIALGFFCRSQYFGQEVPIATDYNSKLIAGYKLTFEDTVTKQRIAVDEYYQCTVRIPYYDEFYSLQESQEWYEVTVSGPAHELSLTDLLNYLQTTSPTIDAQLEAHKEPVVDALNVIFSYRPFQQCFRNHPSTLPNMATTNGKKFFGVPSDPQAGTLTTTGATLEDERGRFGGGLDSVPGFARSVRARRSNEANLILNVHSVTSLFYHPTTVQELIDLWKLKHNPPNSIWTPTKADDLAEFLNNLSVRTKHYGPYENSFRRISGVPRLYHNNTLVEPSVWSTVMRHRNQNQGMPVATYFWMHYWQQYHEGDQTYVVTIGEDAATETAPADCLEVMPGQLYSNPKELPFRATRSPGDNRGRVLQPGRSIFFGDTPNTKGPVQFQLELANELLQVPFTKLALPQVQYRTPGNSLVTMGAAGGSWNLRGQYFVKTSTVQQRWTYLELTPHNQQSYRQDQRDQFRDGLDHTLRAVGMLNFDFVHLQNHVHVLQNPDISNKKHRFKNLYDEIERKFKELKGIDLIMIILWNQNIDVYSAVKMAGDQTLGVPTVCSILKNKFRINKFSGRQEVNPDYLANLTMKINLKTSTISVNHQLEEKAPILTSKTMIIGIDVTHRPSTALLNAPSIAAVVGSVDDQFAQWPASLRSNPVHDDDENDNQPHKDDEPKKKGNYEDNGKLKRSKPLETGGEVKNGKQLQDGAQLKEASRSKTCDEAKNKEEFKMNSKADNACCENDEAQSSQFKEEKATSSGSRDDKSKHYREAKGADEKSKKNRKKAKEKVVELEEMIFERLRDYWERNRDVPEQIIVYRDGLSEGQFAMCKNEEFPKIRNAIERLKGLRRVHHVKIKDKAVGLEEPTIKVILICAVKRNHTRFFPKDINVTNEEVYCGYSTQGYNFNPLPGTLVEEGVTYGDGQDFFLISQKAIIGTARPTHYVVLENETGHTSREIAQMTHKLCFLFGRATRSVGVCPAVYYADLAAGRARCYARNVYNAPERRDYEDTDAFDLEVHDNLKKKMFYI